MFKVLFTYLALFTLLVDIDLQSLALTLELLILFDSYLKVLPQCLEQFCMSLLLPMTYIDLH